MVLIKEFRIVMPLTLEEFKQGQKYSVARTSKEITTGANGIEVLKVEQYKDEKTGKMGIYTYKIYHLEAYFPGWIKAILPKAALLLYEEAWDCFPHCKTVVSSTFLGKKFSMIIETQHAEDFGEQENILDLTPEELKIRKVIQLDISGPLPDKRHYKKEEDPTLVALHKKKMGPLKKGWQKEIKEKMCCYKLVRAECKLLGFQSRAEKYMMNFEETIFMKFHRQVFCWLDDWYGLSDEQIEKFQNEMYQQMKQELSKGGDDKTKESDANIVPVLDDEEPLELDKDEVKSNTDGEKKKKQKDKTLEEEPEAEKKTKKKKTKTENNKEQKKKSSPKQDS